MAKVFLALLSFVAITVCVLAESNSTTAPQDLKTAGSSHAVSQSHVPSTWADLWKGGLSNVLTIGGMILGSLVFISGIVWHLGLNNGRNLRLCNLFGSCEKQMIKYNSAGNLQDPTVQSNANGYSEPQYYSNYYNNGYLQKRSIDILAPVFKKLASTLETVQPAEESKSSDNSKKQEKI